MVLFGSFFCTSKCTLKKQGTYFKICLTYFKISQTYFFLCSRSLGKRFVTGTLVNGLMCLYFKRQNTDMLLNTEKLYVAFL